MTTRRSSRNAKRKPRNAKPADIATNTPALPSNASRHPKEIMAEMGRGFLSERKSDGFNVRFNAGAAAGQTVFHAHIHVIPRYTGDVGGIRHAVIGHGHYNLPTP